MTESVFRAKAPGIMRLLMADFGLTAEEAAAIMGNLGHESGGLTAFQEAKPTVVGSRGGWGWAQWTGPRRVKFEAYCTRNNLDPKSDKANYGWLFVELKGTEKGAILALKKADGLRNKVIAFEGAFERAGIKHYESRVKWAERALAAYAAEQPAPDIPTAEPEVPDNKELNAMIQVLLPMLAPIIAEAVKKAVTSAVNNPSVPLDSPSPREAAQPVAEQVVAEVARKIETVAAPKPWYKSTTMQGLIVSGVGLIGSALGFTLAPEQVDTIAALVGQGVSAIGLLIAARGRAKAVQPIGG